VVAVNTPKGKPRPKLRDFMFDPGPAPRQTWQQQLAIAKQVTAMMGGEVKSDPSTGSG